VREGWYNPLQRPFAAFAYFCVRGTREYRSLTQKYAKTRRETGDLYIEDDNKH